MLVSPIVDCIARRRLKFQKRPPPATRERPRATARAGPRDEPDRIGIDLDTAEEPDCLRPNRWASEIAKALNIGRASVYRVLEAG
jgi:hypothetical protein